jgi:hypothetical protein
MHKLRTAVLSGVTMLAVAGAALAAGRDMQVMKVGLPDRLIANIEYKGDVAPEVTVAKASSVLPGSVFDAFDIAPFAAFDRIAASMNQDMEAMIYEIGAFQPAPPSQASKIDLAALSNFPLGTVHYQVITAREGGSTCSRFVEVTYYGPDRTPKVVSDNSENCAPTNPSPTPTRLDDPAPPVAPALAKTGTKALARRPRAVNFI